MTQMVTTTGGASNVLMAQMRAIVVEGSWLLCCLYGTVLHSYGVSCVGWNSHQIEMHEKVNWYAGTCRAAGERN